MYQKIDPTLKVTEREDKVSKFWEENNIFQESIKEREGCPVYTFFDGPPTANGKPHIGHVITRAIKDLFPRYKTMKGYKVLRKAGVFGNCGSRKRRFFVFCRTVGSSDKCRTGVTCEEEVFFIP